MNPSPALHETAVKWGLGEEPADDGPGPPRGWSISDRRGVVQMLAESGLSTREIALIVGMSQKTISNDRKALGVPARQPRSPELGIEEMLSSHTVRRDGRGGCWEWCKYRNPAGYGQTSWKGHPWVAHRLVYHLYFEPLAPGDVIRHRCDNPPCCNPHHLEPGTQAENIADMVTRGRSAGGERHSQSRLTEREVIEIRERYEMGGVYQKDLALEYGVSQSTVCSITTGKTWSHLSTPRGSVVA